jgi:hypothetical protein
MSIFKLILLYIVQSTIITLLAMKFINVRQDKAVMFGLMTFGVFFVLDGLIFPLFPQMEPTGIAHTIESDLGSFERGAERIGRSALHGVERVGRSTLNGVERVGSAVGSDMRSVGRSVGRGAERVGRAVVDDAVYVGRGTERVGRAALDDVEYVGDAIGSDMRSVGRSVESVF